MANMFGEGKLGYINLNPLILAVFEWEIQGIQSASSWKQLALQTEHTCNTQLTGKTYTISRWSALHKQLFDR